MLDTERLLTKYYCGITGWVGGTTEFHRLLERFIPTGDRFLELGPGPANATSRFLAGRGTVTGLDVSEELFANPWLSEAVTYDGGRFPFPDNSFDACVSDFVNEHLSDPLEHFREVERVLRPGGVYCFRTPNLWHYVTLASRILPHRAHLRLANRLRNLGEDAHEPYPTVYAANTRSRIRRLARAAGLSTLVLNMIEKEPSYGMMSPFLFGPMMLYERFVNSSPILADFRVNIQGVLQKPLR